MRMVVSSHNNRIFGLLVPRLLLIVLLLTTLNISFASSFNINDGLVSYWTLDNATSNKYVSYPNELSNATIINTTSVIGISSNGTKFNGQNGYLNMSNPNRLQTSNTNQRTIRMWLNFTSNPDAFDTIFNEYQTSQNVIWFPTASLSTLKWEGQNGQFGLNGSMLSLNTWYEITITQNTTGTYGFINGVLVNSSSGNDVFTITHFNVGDNDAVQTRTFNGSVDEIGVWNYSMSVSDISNLHNVFLGTPLFGVTLFPVNGSGRYVGNHNYFDLNVSSIGFGGTTSTTLYFYNSTRDLLYSYFSTSNPFLQNITSLPIGTYYANATVNNYTNFDVFNQIYINQTGQYDGVRQGGQTGSSFNGSQYVEITSLNMNLNQSESSACQWVNYRTFNMTVFPYVRSLTFNNNGGGVDSFFSQFINSSRLYSINLVNYTSSSTGLNGPVLNYNQDYTLCYTFNSSGILRIYQNGSLFAETSISSGYFGKLRTITGLRIGNSRGNSNPMNGSVYKTVVWNRSLSASEIAFEYSLGPNTPTNITDGLVLQYLLNNSASVYSNSTHVFNVNLTSSRVGGFENSSSLYTYYIYNVTSNGIITPSNNANLSSRFYNITWNSSTFTPSGTGLSIANYNVSLRNSDGTLNRTIVLTSNNSFYWDNYEQNLSLGLYKVRVQSIDSQGNGQYQENTINITTNTLLNISARDNFGNLIQNFTIYTYNPTYRYNNTITTNNYLASVDQIRGNINLSLDAEGYALANFSLATVNVNSPTYNYQFNLYATNTINFTFYNQSDNKVMTQNVSYDLIGSLASYTNVSGGSNSLISLIVPDNYIMRYASPNFTTRFYYLTVSNRSYQNINLYLIKETEAYNWTVYVVNEVLNPVEGAVVKNFKYDLATNTYILQEIGLTDIQGKTPFTVTFNDEFYKQMVEYQGDLKKVTSPDYIDSASITIPITLGNSNLLNDLNNYEGIGSSFVFNNDTNNFRFDWSDSQLLASSYCIYIYKIDNSSQNDYNSSCVTGASGGSVLRGVANGSGYLYYSLVTYVDGGVEKYLDSLYYEYPTNSSDLPLGNKFGLFLQFILSLGMTSLAILNIMFAMILLPFSLIIGKIMGWNAFSWAGLLALQVVGIIFAIMASMRK